MKNARDDRFLFAMGGHHNAAVIQVREDAATTDDVPQKWLVEWAVERSKQAPDATFHVVSRRLGGVVASFRGGERME